MKKLFILIHSFLLLLCLFVPIYADDDEIEIITEEQEQKEYVEKQDYEKDINELKDDIKEIENLAKGGTSNLGGKKINYNELSYLQIKYFYEHYSNIDLAVEFKTNNTYILYVYNYNLGDYSISTNNNYYFDYIPYHWYRIDPDGSILEQSNPNNENAFRIYKTQNTTGDGQGVYVSKVDWEYNLRPYHLHIINNGLGEITTEIPSNYGGIDSWDWYLYSGQEVDISYSDLDDFTGWFDINGNLVSNDENYIFNITQDTTLIINYYTNPQIFDYTNLLYIIIGLLTFIFFNDITKGVLN